MKKVGEINVTVKSNKVYIIPFVGLKLGVHKFEYDITDAFFDSIDYSIIDKGNVKVELSLEKKETMLLGEFSLKGKVETNCNRCNDPCEVKIKASYKLVYKFGTEESDDESLIVIQPEEFEINVQETILELITVSLPVRAVHKKGECNEEMMAILNEYILVSEDENSKEDDSTSESDDDQFIDPRWAALKKLK